MLGDPWPEEPDDPYPDPTDPESRFDLEIPDGSEASRELHRAFWGLVAVFNVGLFATALGAMLVAFRGSLLVGGSVLAVGVATLAYGVHRYRVYRRTGVASAAD